MNPVRLNITIPAQGAYELRDLRGFALYVFDGPDTSGDYAGIPTLHLDTPNGDAVPLHRGASVRSGCGWNRLYVRGNGIAGTLTLLVFQKPYEVCGPVLTGLDTPSSGPDTYLFDINQGSTGMWSKDALDDDSIAVRRDTGPGKRAMVYDPVRDAFLYYSSAAIHSLPVAAGAVSNLGAKGLSNGNAIVEAMCLVGRQLVVSYGQWSGKQSGVAVWDADTWVRQAEWLMPLHSGTTTNRMGCVHSDGVYIWAGRPRYTTGDFTINTECCELYRFDMSCTYQGVCLYEQSDGSPGGLGDYRDVATDDAYLYVAYEGRVHRFNKGVMGQPYGVDAPLTNVFIHPYNMGLYWRYSVQCLELWGDVLYAAQGASTIGQGALALFDAQTGELVREVYKPAERADVAGDPQDAPGDIAYLSLGLRG